MKEPSLAGTMAEACNLYLPTTVDDLSRIIHQGDGDLSNQHLCLGPWLCDHGGCYVALPENPNTIDLIMTLEIRAEQALR